MQKRKKAKRKKAIRDKNITKVTSGLKRKNTRNADDKIVTPILVILIMIFFIRVNAHSMCFENAVFTSLSKNSGIKCAFVSWDDFFVFDD
jgi:hypothetical protein